MSFYDDVIRPHRLFGSTHRVADVALLEPVTREGVAALISAAAVAGIRLIVWETYRSGPRQQQLFEQKATKLRTVGVHHYGLAADIVRDNNGEPSWKGDFKFLGKLARKQGLIWGGDWGNAGKQPSFYDPYHVQRCTVARQRYLFTGAWYPGADYDPYV